MFYSQWKGEVAVGLPGNEYFYNKCIHRAFVQLSMCMKVLSNICIHVLYFHLLATIGNIQSESIIITTFIQCISTCSLVTNFRKEKLIDFLHFWSDFTEEEKKHVGVEISDVLLYLINLADKCHIDLPTAVLDKIEKNKAKYPKDKAYGKSDKYTAYQ